MLIWEGPLKYLNSAKGLGSVRPSPSSCSYSPKCLEELFYEVRIDGVLRTSLWGELALYHRLGRTRGGYGIRVPMHDLPGSLFGSKGHRDS
jgi:hypothetical protein